MSSTQAKAWDTPHAKLHTLPRGLWLGTCVTACGTASERLRDVPVWMASLLAGELPPEHADLGDAHAAGAFRQVIAKLQLTAMARGLQPAVEQVLRTMLWHLDTVIDRPEGTPHPRAVAAAALAFEEAWSVERHAWDEVTALLMGAGDLSQLSSDALLGKLKRREWAMAHALQAQLAQAPEIVAMLARLGRGIERHRPRASTMETDEAAPRPMAVVDRVTELPDAPGRMHGIKLGRSLSRMVSADAAQFAHPVLHTLWRARMAEGRLRVWDETAEVIDRVVDPGGVHRQALPSATKTRQRGPMIVCVDTSSSMKGAPERLAKAVVFEAAKVAHREGRGCHLIAFGGPGEVVERTLGLDSAGLDAVLDLLGQSFDGGTDVASPLECAIHRVLHEGWHLADILIVSDGEFGVTREVHAKLDEASSNQGLLVHGLLIGDRETMGLLEVCDHIHWVRDWRRFDPASHTAQQFSPVHSKSLTALYFPQALNQRVFDKHAHIIKLKDADRAQQDQQLLDISRGKAWR